MYLNKIALKIIEESLLEEDKIDNYLNKKKENINKYGKLGEYRGEIIGSMTVPTAVSLASAFAGNELMDIVDPNNMHPTIDDTLVPIAAGTAAGFGALKISDPFKNGTLGNEARIYGKRKGKEFGKMYGKSKFDKDNMGSIKNLFNNITPNN